MVITRSSILENENSWSIGGMLWYPIGKNSEVMDLRYLEISNLSELCLVWYLSIDVNTKRDFVVTLSLG